jgi:hypothetical protein
MEPPAARADSYRGETGYSWLYRATALNGKARVTITVLIIAVAAGIFAWYNHQGSDNAPDSILGYIYAVIGTVLLLLAAILFTVRRRSHRQRVIGGLRSSLGWHMCFGIMGLAFVSMHSFGEFNLRTGTYALYGMIALVLSGLVGRLLDRVMPRLIAGEVHRALTAQGEDRIEQISQKLQATVIHQRKHIRAFPAQPAPTEGIMITDSNALTPLKVSTVQPSGWREQTLHTPWDLGYISLEATPQELRGTGSPLQIPARSSSLDYAGPMMPGAQEHMHELEAVQSAMKRELFYRYITRYWRRFHILLALTTLGLVVWHIVYALQLLLPTLIH